ncbi:MAG: aminoglycoside 6-adenylyltransferase [Chitinophagaceae bacterium]|jgi:aminoglycoside 6-adenylyltransferase|nr:aminoglycoside 6-adenylyltransferase [Chitinophagaceae bacterium]
MRTENEMFDTILSFAKNDDCVRAVAMEGSRLNKNIPKDLFQDFDITFFVTDLNKYTSNDNWLDVFGERVMMQKPAEMPLFPLPHQTNKCTQLIYLMLFKDGNRLDLKVMQVNEMAFYFKLFADSLCKILLDKDNICPAIPEPSDIDFHVKKPDEIFIDNCSNEFWWLSTYVTKGICRNEFLYAAEHLNLMRQQLLSMLSWSVGIETSFSLSVGKSYKYLNKYVSKETWDALLKTYKNDTIDFMWDSLILCCNLFQETEKYVSEKLGYQCPEYNKNVINYLKQYIPVNKWKQAVLLG